MNCRVQHQFHRQSLMTKSKSSTSCWTCRLRHKRCDGVVPACGVCLSLEISCYHSHSKPEWMDSWSRQHEMARQVKAEVRRSAVRRRGRKIIENITQNLADIESGNLDPQDRVPSSFRPKSSSHTNTASTPNVAIESRSPSSSLSLEPRPICI
jgi:C6 transcription factor Pro1